MTRIYKVLIGGKDESDVIANLSWSDNIETLGVEFSFDIAKEFTRIINLGESVVFLKNGVEVFKGIVVAREISELTINCICYDFAWYLNKSTVIKQFKKMKGNVAIKSLCKELGINVEVDGAEAIIECIYKDKTVIDVIKDILQKSTQETGKRFNIEMEGNLLRISPFKKININGEYELSEKDVIKINDNIGHISYSDSVIEMKNKIVVVSGNDKAIRIVNKIEDKENIDKYGLLQEVVILDAKDYKNAKNVADNKLKELNKITQDISIDVLGDTLLKSGRLINLSIKKYNLEGKYLIKSSSHSIDGGIHKTNLTLEVFDE